MTTLQIKVQPNAKESRIVEWLDDSTLRIRLAAPPVDGKANKALIAFLAKSLGLKKSQVRIAKGEKNRQKVLEFDGLDEADLQKRINSLLLDSP